MKTSPPSPTMIALMLKIVEHERHSRVPFTINDEPTRTVVALLDRGLIETWQEGTTTHSRRRSMGGGELYWQTTRNIPVIRARITAAGYGAIADAR